MSRRLKLTQLWTWLSYGWLGIGIIALGITLWLQTIKSGGDVVSRTRNFYGVLTVYEHDRDNPESHHVLLQHGQITHGLQLLDPQRVAWPTSYYGEDSGVGLAIKALPAASRRLALVGLGAGTVAAYGRLGDTLRLYEINPEVVRLAQSPFRYLSNCLGKVELVPGDARLSLEREPPQNFDLLVLDAFDSDAIPIHLLTREAFEVYQRHLKPDGLIAIHVSNRHVDLLPVISNVARCFHYSSALIDYAAPEQKWWVYTCTWVLVARNHEVLSSPAIRGAAAQVGMTANRIQLWTDEFASVFPILK